MKEYRFRFLRKGTVLSTEKVFAKDVPEACRKADAMLKTHARKCDDWEMINPTREKQ